MALAESSVSQRPSGCGRRVASAFSASNGSTPPDVDAATPVLTRVAASLAICCCVSPTSRSTRSIGVDGPWPTRSRSAW